MKRFNLDEFKKRGYDITCETEEQVDKFLKYLDSKGIKWWNGEKLFEIKKSREVKINIVCFFYQNGLCFVDTATCGMDLNMLKYTFFEFA